MQRLTPGVSHLQFLPLSALLQQAQLLKALQQPLLVHQWFLQASWWQIWCQTSQSSLHRSPSARIQPQLEDMSLQDWVTRCHQTPERPLLYLAQGINLPWGLCMKFPGLAFLTGWFQAQVVQEPAQRCNFLAEPKDQRSWIRKISSLRMWLGIHCRDCRQGLGFLFPLLKWALWSPHWMLLWLQQHLDSLRESLWLWIERFKQPHSQYRPTIRSKDYQSTR